MPDEGLVCQARSKFTCVNGALVALDTAAPIWQVLVMARGRVGDGMERCSSLYRFINFEDLV